MRVTPRKATWKGGLPPVLKALASYMLFKEGKVRIFVLSQSEQSYSLLTQEQSLP